MSDVSAREAARLLGISLDTLRRWDARGRITTRRDEHNRRMVPMSEIERLTPIRRAEPELRTHSARNRIDCVITGVEVDGLLARIEMDSVEPARLVAIITRESAEELELEAGSSVVAVVKATSMMVDRRV